MQSKKTAKKKDQSALHLNMLVRRAHAERAAYLGDLIGSGLAALARAASRGITVLAKPWRSKERAAAR